jgi:predicted dehydrogenase
MKKIKAAVIGVGYLGRLHAQKYSQIEEAELVGVMDIDPQSAEEVARNTGSRAFKTHEELLGLVDAVSVVTPTESHLKVGMDFLEHGKHVLIEKPIAVDTDEAGKLIRAAEKAGVVLQVGHLERFNAAVVALEGRLTNPMYIESQRLSPFPNRSTDVDVILDLMIHDIDIILNLVDSEIKSIDAVGIPVITKKVDLANARIKFENGCVADVTASRVSKERKRQIKLYQSESFITIDYANQHILTTRIVPDESAGFARLVDEDLGIEKRDSLLEEIRSFVGCAATGGKPLVSGRDGLVALEVATRIQASVEASMKDFKG